MIPCRAMLAGTLLSVIVAACSSMNQQLDPQVFYKRDITVEVNGVEYEGVVTIPRAASYKLKLKPKGDLDMILLRSCHRQDTAEKKSSGFFVFSGNNTFEYSYKPIEGLEDVRTCPLRIDAYESAKGRHSWSFIEFAHPDYTVPFKMDCNGRSTEHKGVAVCQAKSGLIQRLRFHRAIRFAPPHAGCAMPIKVADGAYDVELAVGECLYHFDTEIGELGKVTFLGYQGVLVRESQ